MRWIAVVLSLVAVVGCRTSAGDRSPDQASESLTVPSAESVAAQVAAPPCDWPASGAWPVFQRNPARLGASTAQGIVKPTLKWSKEVGIASWLNNPVVVGEHVFVGSSGQAWNQPDGADGVSSMDLETGEAQWFFAVDGDVNGVAYANCRVFATSDAGLVVALDARTGKVLWRFEAPAKIYTNPLPVGDLVIVGDAKGSVWAVDARDGEARWSNRLSGPIRGGAAFDGARIFVTSQAMETAALDPATGDFVWVRRLETPGGKEIYAAPTVVKGLLVVGYARDTTYPVPAFVAYDAKTGADVWTASDPENLQQSWGNVRSSPAVVDGRLVYGEPYSNRIVSIDAATGAVTSSTAAGPCMFPHWPSAAVAADVYYVPRHSGGLYAFDNASGRLNWALYLGDANRPPLPFPDELRDGDWSRCEWDPPVGRAIYASPAIADDGTVIVATGDGYLHAVGNAGE